MQPSNEMKAKIFAAYLGSPVIQFSSLKGILIGVSKLNATIQFDGSKTSAWRIADCQLILKPLSSISDEDAIEVAKIIKCPYCENDVSELKPHLLYALANGSALAGDKVIKSVDYLRSKSYDLGYGSIPSLIEIGIAPTPL